MIGEQRIRRFRALRVGLAVFIACFLFLYAASSVYRGGYQHGRQGLAISCGALWSNHWSKHYYDGMVRGGLCTSGWWFERHFPPFVVQWPEYRETVYPQNDKFQCLVIPLWIPLIPLLVLAAFFVYQDRTRRVPGLCSKCGYDLTSNTSGRCPECGTAIPEGAVPSGK